MKQDLIQDGDLSIAKTDGLLTALDSSAKLASANTFSGLQTINGDLKADHVLVKIISPTHKRTEGRASVWGSEFTSKRRRTTGGIQLKPL